MEVYTKKTIDYCPYSAMIFLPPELLHLTTFYKISFIERGSCTLNIFSQEGKAIKSIELHENDAFIVPAFVATGYQLKGCKNYLHRDIYVDENEIKELCSILSPNLFDEISSYDVQVFRISSPALIYYAERASLLIGQEITKEKDYIHKALIIDLLGYFMSNKAQKDATPLWINTLLRNLDDESFVIKSISEMVKTTNYSHGYVNREFKKYMNCSLKSYVNGRKLAFSSVMLATTNISLQEIVDRLGFTTTSNFINVFKAKYGITPAKYRRSQGASISQDTYQEWGEVSRR